MMLATTDTIAAIASARGPAPRGIVRISGPAAESCWRALAHPTPTRRIADSLPAPLPSGRIAASEVIECQLQLGPPWPAIPCSVWWWPGSRSYTRAPTAELHLPGSPPLLDATLAQICRAGARMAAPGEFTMRAFLAGRLDLTQAEAVLGVIDARDQRELEVALRQLAGGLAGPLHSLRDRLLDSLARLEAGLDFVEEDIEFVTADELEAEFTAILQQLDQVMGQLSTRVAQDDLPRVALVGLPNVGKSSLFNALVGEAAAIVADIPGTTRDYVERVVTTSGRRFRLIDTAGLESEWGLDQIVGESQRLALREHEAARLKLLCLDASRSLTIEERSRCDKMTSDPTSFIVLTKADATRGLLECEQLLAAGAFPVSSLTGEGLERLRTRIAEKLLSLEDGESAVVAGTAARCRDSLERARESLRAARDLVIHGGGDELVAVEIRVALDELGRVVGAVHTDDLLDVIFSRFCIGK
ncbi:MAG: tRNA modification GTPase [Pirellulales bacterium]